MNKIIVHVVWLFYVAAIVLLAMVDWKAGLGAFLLGQSNYLAHVVDKDFWHR